MIYIYLHEQSTAQRGRFLSIGLKSSFIRRTKRPKIGKLDRTSKAKSKKPEVNEDMFPLL